MNPEILVYSEDPDFYMLLSHILTVEGFQPSLSGAERFLEVAVRPVSAIILDIGKNAPSAAQLCSTLKAGKATASIPTIALVSSGNEFCHLDLLRMGIDESFARPISPAGLIAYLRFVCSGEGSKPMSSSANALDFGTIHLEIDRRQVRHAGKEFHLSPIEFELLRLLFQQPGHVFSRPELIAAAWPPNIFVHPRTVDVHVGHLRRMLKDITGRDLIRTVRSIGYASTLSET
jgi:DNA-binding response OmpR family regulator